MADSLKSKDDNLKRLRELAGFSRETLAQYTVAINTEILRNLPRNSKLEGLQLRPRPIGFESVSETTIRNAEVGEFITRSKLVAIAYALNVVLKDIAYLDGDENPFCGLAAYQVENRGQYFGRSREIDEALTKLSKTNLLAVIGNSGAGKSSFILAGVLPELADQQDFLYTILEPGDVPLRTLVGKVFSDFNNEKNTLSGSDFEELIVDAKLSSSALEVWLRRLGRSKPNRKFVIVVDQWEQLYAENCEDSQQFITLLTQASKSGLLTVLLTIRADFYGDIIDGDQEFFALFDKGRFELAPIGDAGIREIVTGPTALNYEIGVVENLIKETSNNDGSLPLLSFVLEQLWNYREPKTGRISNEIYHTNIGNFDQAIGNHAKYCFEQMPEEQKYAARLYLPSLVDAIDRGGDLREIRGRRRLSESTAVEKQLIEYLSGPDCRILRIVGEDESFVELAHEILLRAWHDLREWINDDRVFWVERNKIAHQTEVYRSDSKAFLQGKPLKHALELLSKYGKRRLGLAESEFIKASARHWKWRRGRFLIFSLTLIPIAAMSYEPLISPYLVNYCPIDAINYSIQFEKDYASQIDIYKTNGRAVASGKFFYKGVLGEVVTIDMRQRGPEHPDIRAPAGLDEYRYALSFNVIQGDVPCCWVSLEDIDALSEIDIIWNSSPLAPPMSWDGLQTGNVRLSGSRIESLRDSETEIINNDLNGTSLTGLQLSRFDRMQFDAIGCQPLKLLRYWIF